VTIAIASLGSGSNGNATLIRVESSLLLIDAGFTARKLVARMNALGVYPEQLSAILISHEHIDHTRGLAVLARKFNIPVWLTAGTFAGLREDTIGRPELIHPHGCYRIADAQVSVFPIPHDAREPCQFIVGDGKHRIAVATDMGCVTPHVSAQLQRLDSLLIEANYDPLMLANGSYPVHLQRRISGSYGHLSNEQALALLQRIETGSLQHVLLGHLSGNNNTPQHVRNSVADFRTEAGTNVDVLSREQASDWYFLQ